MKQDIRNTRAYYLIKLARALYESAVHEEDRERLELHRQVAVEASGLFDEASEVDGTLHPDLGLELLLFIELKKAGISEAEAYRKDTLSIIEEVERETRRSA